MTNLNISLKQFAINEGIEVELDDPWLNARTLLSTTPQSISTGYSISASNATQWSIHNAYVPAAKIKQVVHELEAETINISQGFFLEGGGSISNAALTDSTFNGYMNVNCHNVTFDYASNVIFNGAVGVTGALRLSDVTILPDGQELMSVIADIQNRLHTLENPTP